MLSDMKNRLQFWQVYVGAGIVAILVIGVTIYWNFFGPYRPAEPQLQYATAQLVFTAVGILGIIFSLLFATHQFAQSQRRPDLKLVFADSLTTSATVQIPPEGISIHNIDLAVVNKGDTVAIWFEVIVNLSNVPWGNSYTAPAWVQVGEQYEYATSGLTLHSFGKAAVFTTTPLRIGVVQCFDVFATDQSKYEIPYQINGDWGAPKTGSLWLNVKPVEA
jgi:hypothetical protein